ncbi:MAG: hypothetical protein R2686_00525 [Candidatus Nanopelagicales bacterium]|jgi:hypothetical protein
MASHEQKLPTVDTPSELWKHHPDEHDYPAADSYLSLCFDPETAKKLSHALRKAPIELHKAKDLLRSAELPLLSLEDPSVQRDLAKVVEGVKLAPVLIVRGDLLKGLKTVIADGYHRTCASYHLSENESIPCAIIDHP